MADDDSATGEMRSTEAENVSVAGPEQRTKGPDDMPGDTAQKSKPQTHPRTGSNRVEAANGTARQESEGQVEEFAEPGREHADGTVTDDGPTVLARLRNLVFRRGKEPAGPASGIEEATALPETLRRRYGVHVSDDGRKIELFEAGAKAAAITLEGASITTPHNQGSVIADVVDLARDRGWQALRVDGTSEFRDAIWLEGSKIGLAVSHQPSSAIQAAFEKWDRERPENRVRSEIDTMGDGSERSTRQDLAALFAANSPAERLADPRLRNAHLELMVGVRTAEKELGRTIGEMPDVQKALAAAVGQQLASGRMFGAPFVIAEHNRPEPTQVDKPIIKDDKIGLPRH